MSMKYKGGKLVETPTAQRQALEDQWSTVEPITPEQIKAEAYQRITAVCPEWKQRNLTAQASILAEKGRANWSAEELAAWDAGEAIWQQIAAVRARSDELEAMDPIPQDYDARWP